MSDIQPGSPDTSAVAKAQAKRLKVALCELHDLPIKHGQALELVARLHGQQSWGHLNATFASQPESPKDARPALKKAGPKDLVIFERVALFEIVKQLNTDGQMANTFLIDFLMHMPQAKTYGFKPSSEIIYFERLTLGEWEEALDAYDDPYMRKLLLKHAMRDYIERTQRANGTFWEVQEAKQTLAMRNLDLISDRRDAFAKSYPLKDVPVPFEKHCIHALYQGMELAPLKEALPEAVDFTGNSVTLQKRLADTIGLHIPDGGFANGVAFLKWYCSARCSEALHAKNVDGARPGQRQTIIIAMSDLSRVDGADVFVAQARSVGFNLVIWADDLGFDPKSCKSIVAQVDTFMQNDPFKGAVFVRNGNLEETLGGVLHRARPGRPLSWREKVHNTIAQIRH